jgi:maltooligosyltrehalose trehalohydrolase
MLFQGQEFAASSPFFFFADQKANLAKLIRQGRIAFLKQWRSLRSPEMRKCLIDPCSEHTFERSKVDFSELSKHQEWYNLHRDLLKLRQKDPVLSLQGEHGIDGAVLSESVFVLRYFSPGFRDDRLLVVNLGRELELNPSPEPLLAPPRSARWLELWSSDDARYGGCGTAPLDTNENWRIPGQAAVALYPVIQHDSSPSDNR